MNMTIYYAQNIVSLSHIHFWSSNAKKSQKYNYIQNKDVPLFKKPVHGVPTICLAAYVLFCTTHSINQIISNKQHEGSRFWDFHKLYETNYQLWLRQIIWLASWTNIMWKKWKKKERNSSTTKLNETKIQQ